MCGMFREFLTRNQVEHSVERFQAPPPASVDCPVETESRGSIEMICNFDVVHGRLCNLCSPDPNGPKSFQMQGWDPENVHPCFALVV